MAAPPTTLVLFARALRLDDHPALAEAAAKGPVLPLFLDGPETDLPQPDQVGRPWLGATLDLLDADLRARGSRLIRRRGVVADVLPPLLDGVGAVFLQRGLTPGARALEDALRAVCTPRGVAVEIFEGETLYPPEAVRTRQGGVFKVFTPFHRACDGGGPPPPPEPAPDRLAPPPAWPDDQPLDIADDGLDTAMWPPGEAGAMAQAEAFLDRALATYGDQRDVPASDIGASGLSVPLRFGTLGPRRLWHLADGRPGAAPFQRQLAWRDFAHHLLFHAPGLMDRPLRPEFARFPWLADTVPGAWTDGRTGFPVIDAGLRQLAATGWMHNRVRMIAASFLVKDLLVDWRAGAADFRRRLLDWDPANNTLGWQWVAGCGPDAAPYFRIFNPVLQSRKFDPHGAYIRAWVPELAGLADRHVHAPWEAPGGPPAGYPPPLVDRAVTRQRALDAFATLRDDA
ncbi:MAG: deoxyribodipyrimidine photo-lyase [Rhodobacterales bacterium]|nr:deoxyribodipyrimidine photo-lyase [Rhodobacterales bacterium]